MARIHVEVYGCSANQADFEMVQGLLCGAGHTLVGEPEAADAFVVLTCTVKTPTERKIVKRIRRLSDLGGPLIVAGCMPEAQRGLVEETAPGASMVGPDNLLDIVDVVEAAIEGGRVEALQGGALDRTCLPRIRRNPVIHIAPVASGCLGDCSYCIVRRARGRLSSFPAERIVDDAKRALGEGCREIWVTAEDTAGYRDGEIRQGGDDEPEQRPADPRRSHRGLRLGEGLQVPPRPGPVGERRGSGADEAEILGGRLPGAGPEDP